MAGAVAEGPCVAAGAVAEGPCVAAGAVAEGPCVAAGAVAEGSCVAAGSVAEGPCVAAGAVAEGSCVAAGSVAEGPCVAAGAVAEGPCVAAGAVAEGPCVAAGAVAEGPCVVAGAVAEGPCVEAGAGAGVEGGAWVSGAGAGCSKVDGPAAAAGGAESFGWTKKAVAEVPSREKTSQGMFIKLYILSCFGFAFQLVFLCWVGGHFSDTVRALLTGAGCAMNLFGIADVQLTRGKVVVYSLHHRQHVLTEGHPLVPLSVGGLRVLHLG